MTERAAHLVDAVLPWVPVRQWVLTVPYRLRYQMAGGGGRGDRRRRPLKLPTLRPMDAYVSYPVCGKR